MSIASGPPPPLADETGAATVEHAGLLMLLAVLFLALIAAVLGGGAIDDRLGQGLANRIACGPRAPGPCRQEATVSAYGWPVARLLRALAPEPMARPDRSGRSLVPVDFRYCRRPSCAAPSPGAAGHLTLSNRRTTAFTEVQDRRRSGGGIELDYWLYRPGSQWELIRRRVGPAELEAASRVRLNLSQDPRLVPLETLPGRNHYEFGPDERAPWQWRIGATYPGWSS